MAVPAGDGNALLSPGPAPEADNNHSASHGCSSQHHEQFIAILFPFFALALGVVARMLLKVRIFGAVKMPYTAALLVIGILFGIWNHEMDLQELGESFDMWIRINPEVLLFGFLPVLVFASGLNANVHIFFKVFSQCILLAGPGVALGAFLTAVIAKYVFDYGWGWNVSMVLGSILAATDPVAVVALLKDVGASPRLGTVIEGESLLNDGIAIVFFNLFLAYSAGRSDPTICYGWGSDGSADCIKIGNAGGVIRYFSQVTLGGPAVGIAFALGVVVVINFTTDIIIEISLTLALAYLSYFVADFTAGTSGVLAVVTAGTMVAYLGRPSIVGEENNALEVFWEMIEFIANTIIFVLAGLIIGNNFLALDDIGGKEWGYLVVLYIFVYLIRLTIVSLFYPLLMRLGYGLSMKEGAVVVHGGLRGAVGLALAIRVQEMSLQGYQDGLDYDLTKNDGNRILFFVGGIAVLTLLVQATTTEALMRRMGMFVLSMGTKRTQEETMVSLQDKAFETYKDNYSDPFIGEAIPAIVARLVPNISISELVTVSENSNGDGEKNSGARATVHETEEYAELRGRLARVNSVQLHEDAKKPEASPSPSKLSRKMSAKLVRAETIQEPSTGEKTMSDRRTAILTEEDLLSFGAPSWLTLEAIRPYLADLEVRFLNGVLSAYKKMREKNIITSRTELILHQSIDHALDTPEMVNDWDVLSPFCSYKKNSEPSSTDTEGGEEPNVGDNDGDAGGEDDALHNKWRITSMLLSFAELVFAVFGIHHSFDDLYLGVQLASAYLRARKTTFKTFAELVSLRTEWQVEEDEEDEAIESKMEKSASKDGETRTQIESRMFARLRRRHHGVYFNNILLKCLQKEMDLYDAECTRYLAVIQAQKPYVLAAVKSEQVAAAMLFAQSETLEELYHEGMLVEKEYEDMVHPIKSANLNLHKGPKVLREAQMLYVEENKSEDEKADSKGFTKWVTDGASKLAWV